MYNNKRLGQHLASSSAWSLLGQIVSTVTTFFFFALLSRTLPPASVGTYMLIMNIVMVASIVGTYGIQVNIVRTISAELSAGRYGNVANTVLTGLTLVAMLSLLAGAAIISPAGKVLLDQAFSVPTNLHLMVLIGCWLTLNCTHITITESLRGFHDIKYATIYGASAKNTLLVLIIGVIYISSENMTLEVALLAMNIALALTSVLAVHKLKQHTKPLGIKAHLSRNRAISLLQESTPIFLTSLSYQIVTRSGVFILGYFTTKDELALYGAALQFVVLILVPLRILNSVLPPIISSMYSNDKDHSKLEKTIRSVTTIATLPSLLVILTIVFFGEQLLALTYGSYYGTAHLLLVVLAIGYLSDVAFGPAGFTLMMTGHQTTHLKIVAATGIMAVTLSILAGFAWGSIGVASMAALSTIIQNLTALIAAKNKTGLLCCAFLLPKQILEVFTGVNNLQSWMRNR